MPYTGEIAALVTSLCFSITSTFFTMAGRQVGSVALNRTRLVFAVLFLTVTHWLVYRHPLPLETDPDRMFWFGLSGIIGLVLGDAFLFQAFVWIGPRLSMLMMSLAPILAAILAWVFLSETLSGGQIIGILITVAGIMWVLLERRGNHEPTQNGKSYLRGIIFAFGGATGQALGLITARVGLEGNYSPLSGTLIRMAVAALVVWAITFLQGQARRSIQQMAQHRRVLRFILIGSFTGPFLGVTASLLAVQKAPVGVASTLMALPPVFLLPIGYLVFRERFGWQAIAGTALAILGVGLLFLV